jgi:hypothetical protein
MDCSVSAAALQWRMPAPSRPQKITFEEMRSSGDPPIRRSDLDKDAIHIASALVAEQDDKRVRN